MEKKRILVVAGTHQREIEYTHAVADELISRYGKDMSAPDYNFVGPCGERRGEMWLLGDDLAVGKIYRTEKGEHNRSASVYQPDKCESWEHEDPIHEWTSVTSQMIEQAKPLYMVDLHSYHEGTRNKYGNVIGLFPHTNDTKEHVRRALHAAKSEEPYKYGELNENKFSGPQFEQVVKEFEKKLLDRKKSEERAVDHIVRNTDNYWHLFDNPPCGREEFSHVILEAFQWKKPEITAEFIMKYLIKND